MSMQKEKKALLTDLFVNNIKNNTQNVAVIYDDGVTQNSLTYQEVFAFADKLAKFFQSQNVENESIGFLGESDILYPSIFVGILLIPGIHVIIDKELSGKEILEFTNSLNIRYLLLDDLNYKKYGNNWSNCNEIYQLRYLHFVVHVMEFHAVLKNHDNELDIAYIISTSGTTGTPKIVRVPHSCIIPNIIDFRQTFKISSSDIIFMAAPVTFDPSIVDLFLALSSGAALLIVPDVIKIVPTELINVLFYRQKITVLQATPSLMKRFSAENLQNTLLSGSSSLRILALGGESCPSVNLLKTWRASNNKTKFFNIYGITEVSSWATIYEITEEDFNSSDLLPLGRPLQNTVIKFKDEDGVIVNEGEGQIFLGGQRRCFVDNEHLEEIKEDFLRETGDWVTVMKCGKIYFKGRKDDRVKRNGKIVYLSRIEKVCQTLDYVKDCCAVYDSSHNILALFITLTDVSKKEVVINITRECLNNALPSFAVPDSILTVSVLPITTHGKVDRRKMLKMLLSYQDGITSSSVKIISKEFLKTEWQKQLKNVAVADDDNFLYCGGNSIQLVQFARQIEMHSGCEMPLLIDVLMKSSFKNVWDYINEIITSQDVCFENVFKNQGENNICIDDKLSSSQLTITLDTPKRSCSDNDLMPRNSKAIKLTNENTLNLNNHSHILSLSRGRLFGNFDNYCFKDLNIQNEKDVSNIQDNFRLNIETVWQYDMEKCVDSSPLLVTKNSKAEDAVVYVGSHSNKFAAISSESGKELWSTILGDRIESSACASGCGKFIFVGSYDYCLYCIEAKNGKIKWKYKTCGEIKSSPVVDFRTNSVLVGSHDQHLYCFSIKNGECIWKIRPGKGSVFSSPYLDHNHSPYVYVGTLDGIFCAVSSADGLLIWKKECRKPFFSSPLTTRKGICIGSIDGYLYCYSHDGQEVWKYKTEGPIFSSPCLYNKSADQDDFVIFIGSYDTNLYCIDFSNGKLLWKFAASSPIYGVPFCSFISLNLPNSSAIQPKSSCPELPFSETEGKAASYNKIVNIITFVTTDGTIYVIEADSPNSLSTFPMKNEIFSSPIIWNGAIFVGCRDNLIYKLKIKP